MKILAFIPWGHVGRGWLGDGVGNSTKKLFSSRFVSNIIQKIIEGDARRFDCLIKRRNPLAPSTAGNTVKNGTKKLVITISKSTENGQHYAFEGSGLRLEVRQGLKDVTIVIHEYAYGGDCSQG